MLTNLDFESIDEVENYVKKLEYIVHKIYNNNPTTDFDDALNICIKIETSYKNNKLELSNFKLYYEWKIFSKNTIFLVNAFENKYFCSFVIIRENPIHKMTMYILSDDFEMFKFYFKLLT
jgi:hypothetical protein